MKRITTFLLAMLMVVMLILPTSAADVTSEVYSDLRTATLGGKRFDPAQYPKNSGDTAVHVLTVNERGYSTSDMSEYGLYVYLYNPSGIALDINSVNNRIQMATEWDKDSMLPTMYSKFKLDFVSVSHEKGYEYVFYKFKVGGEIGSGRTINTYVQALGRMYDISGVEVQKMSLSNATECTVGTRFVYYGTEAEQNKTCKASRLETLELEVHHTYFRTESSANGVGHQNQLNAVYFNVPSAYWVSYDFLYAIKCYWEEYRTTPMIVTEDTELLAHLTTWRGRGNGTGYNSSNPITMYSGMKTAYTESPALRTYDWTYNKKLSSTSLMVESSKDNCEAIAWSFYSDDIVLRQADISSAQVMEYWEKHSPEYRDRMITEEGVNEFFSHRVAGPQIHTILFNETFNMDSYASNHSWLDRLFHYNIFNGGAGTNLKDDYSGIDAIQCVDTGHLDLRAAELAKKYFVNPADAEDFKAVVDEGKRTGMKTVVFRYAVTDYFAEEVTAQINGTIVGGTTYRAEQTAFLDFDIISLTFQKDVDLYTIPVSSSPSDFIGGIDAPQVDKDSNLGNAVDYFKDMFSGFGKIMHLLGLLLGVVLVLAILYLLIGLFKRQTRVVVRVGNGEKTSKKLKRKGRKYQKKGKGRKS